jgi:hypothetical protein
MAAIQTVGFISLSTCAFRPASPTQGFIDRRPGVINHLKLATLWRVDENGVQVDAVLGALLRAKGRGSAEISAPQMRFESALSLGDVWALDQIWRELGFGALAGVFRRTRFTTAVEQALRVMVFDRLCDPDSKLGVLRWLETVSMPGIDATKFVHQHLLRSMDALMGHREAVDDSVARLQRELIDEELSLVFCDLMTIHAEGSRQQKDDVRHFGMAKEGVIARQFPLDVVETADAMPLLHEVFDGNVAEVTTFGPMLKKVFARCPHIRRPTMAADRAVLSHIEEISRLTLAAGRALELTLAGLTHLRPPLRTRAAVRPAQAHNLLPAVQACTEGSGTLRHPDQDDDRKEPVVRRPEGGAPAELQQEQDPANLLAQWLAESPPKIPEAMGEGKLFTFTYRAVTCLTNL